MKKNFRVLIPALLVAATSVALIIYYYLHMPARPPRVPGGMQGAPGGGMPPGPGGGKKQGNEFFTLLGNGAILFGILSFWWFLFKKKLASPLPFVKEVGKKLYVVHTYTGYVALLLVVVHGGYYLLTDISNNNILTGLAGFALLMALAVYGWLYKRSKHGKNKALRQTHFLLSILWLLVLFIHAGGFFVVMVIATVALAVLLWWLERKKQTTLVPEPNSK
jgi:hypothetical protein